MKAKKLLAILLAFCLVISAMSTLTLLSVSAATVVPAPADRITSANRITAADVDLENIKSGDKTGSGDTNENPTKIFDNDLDTKLGVEVSVAGGKTWDTIIPLKTAKTITAYTFGTADDDISRDMKSWKMYGSNNGTAWTLIDEVADCAFDTARKVLISNDFIVDSPASYKYYKLSVSAFRQGTDKYAQFSEFVATTANVTAVKAIETQLMSLVGASISQINSIIPAIDSAVTALGAKSNAPKYLLAWAEYNRAYVRTLDPDVAEAYLEIDALGNTTYKSGTAISSARLLYNSLSTQGKAKIKNYSKLTTAETAFNALMSAYSVTFGDDISADNENARVTQWRADIQANLPLSHAAMADEAKYKYSIGINIGIQPGGSKLNRDVWEIGTQLNVQPNDNVGNPWNQNENYMSLLCVPFPGMAFTYDAYAFTKYDYNRSMPIGNMFTYNGKNYQLQTDRVRYYTTTPYVNGNTNVDVSTLELFPGKGQSKTIQDLFIYMSANYNQTEKWNGATIGIPAADAKSLGASSFGQRFEGPSGPAFLITNQAVLNTITKSSTTAGYVAELAAANANINSLVLTGAIARRAYDFSPDFLDYCGNFQYFDGMTAYFDNGTLSALNGFSPDDQVSAKVVKDLIDELSPAANILLNEQAAVQSIRAKYDYLTPTAKVLVTNYAKLQACETEMVTLSSAPAAAKTLMMDILEIGTVTYKSKFAIEDARKAYDALSTSAKGRVKNFATLTAAETAYAAIIAAYKTFTETSTPEVPGTGMDKTPWMRSFNMTGVQISATSAAFGKEALHQYADNAYNIGFNATSGISNGSTAHMEAGVEPNDNITNPWGDGDGRKMAFLNAVFPGMVFSTRYRMAVIDRDNSPLSNQFEYNGRIYQQFWDYQRSYDASTVFTNRNTPCDWQDSNAAPGKGASDALVNAFKYTYAEFSNNNKVTPTEGNDVVLGLINANVVKTGAVEYQQFTDLNGAPIFMILNASNAANITAGIAQSGYITQLIANKAHVVKGALANALKNSIDNLAYVGEITSINATTITFEYGELTVSGLEIAPADYTAVNAAFEVMMDYMPLQSNYTAESWAAIWEIIDNIDYSLYSDKQDIVDGYAYAIYAAIATLVPVPVKNFQLAIAISSTKQAASNGDTSKYDAVWNATVRVNGESDDAAYDLFNAANVNIKEYGVFYGANESAVAKWTELATNPTLGATLKKSVFGAVSGSETEIDMFATYGFRLRNCAGTAVRAAAFYVIYEFGGKTITAISSIDAVNEG